jgi:hypothetical protein
VGGEGGGNARGSGQKKSQLAAEVKPLPFLANGSRKFNRKVTRRSLLTRPQTAASSLHVESTPSPLLSSTAIVQQSAKFIQAAFTAHHL